MVFVVTVVVRLLRCTDRGFGPVDGGDAVGLERELVRRVCRFSAWNSEPVQGCFVRD